MAKKFSARRYAQALFAVAQKKNKADGMLVELQDIEQLNRDKAVAAYLGNPAISFKEKESVLSGKLSDIDPAVVNLVYLMLANGRINMLGAVADEYRKMVDDSKGIERAEVITAVPLDDDARQKISTRLGDMLRKKVVIEPESVNPELLGGVVVKVSGKLLDGSTRSALNILKKEIR
ncbi:MAG: ATP synthase F1 subunit delta [Dehalococcoidales bacterium]|nr:ATP synthase F1 subunit delta [Dehalococcoidales bacterium]